MKSVKRVMLCLVVAAGLWASWNSATSVAQDSGKPPAATAPASQTTPADGQAGRDWPQLQGNPQRTGYTPETIKPPFKVAWKHSFLPERVFRFVQAVTYRGKVYVGTESGNLYALNAADGKDAWKYACGSPIMHTAACANDKVVFSALDGVVYAVNADSGKLAWKFEGDPMYGFSVAPLIADGTVFIGQRGGTFYALNLADGAKKWEFDAGAPVLNSAAYDAGQVFFCDEKLVMHCLDAKSGKEVWKSERLYGQSAKGYCPVIVNGYVIFRPMAAHPFGESFVTAKEWEAIKDGITPAGVAADGSLSKPLMDFQNTMVKAYQQRSFSQDLFILDQKTGKQAFVAPHWPGTLALPGGAGPPVFDGKQSLILPWRFNAFNAFWGRLDLKQQRYVEIFAPKKILGNPDETVNVSVGGPLVFILHCQEFNCQYTGIYDLEKKVCYDLPDFPNRPFTVSDCCQSGNNATSIADGRFYHIVFHSLWAWTSAEGGR